MKSCGMMGAGGVSSIEWAGLQERRAPKRSAAAWPCFVFCCLPAHLGLLCAQLGLQLGGLQAALHQRRSRQQLLCSAGRSRGEASTSQTCTRRSCPKPSHSPGHGA
jgi:hypothetical protein